MAEVEGEREKEKPFPSQSPLPYGHPPLGSRFPGVGDASDPPGLLPFPAAKDSVK